MVDLINYNAYFFMLGTDLETCPYIKVSLSQRET